MRWILLIVVLSILLIFVSKLQGPMCKPGYTQVSNNSRYGTWQCVKDR